MNDVRVYHYTKADSENKYLREVYFRYENINLELILKDTGQKEQLDYLDEYAKELSHFLNVPLSLMDVD